MWHDGWPPLPPGGHRPPDSPPFTSPGDQLLAVGLGAATGAGALVWATGATTTTVKPTTTTGATTTTVKSTTTTSEVTTTTRETTSSSVGGTVSSAPTTSIGGVSSTRAGGPLPFTGGASLPMLLAALALLGLGAASLFAGTRRRRRAA